MRQVPKVQPLATITVKAPGFRGLNTEASSIDLDASWALRAVNCIIDDGGRVAARNGWRPQNSTDFVADVEQLFEYLDSSGNSTVISAAGSKLRTGTTTITDVTGVLTPTNNNWKFQNFNGKVIAWQKGENPIVFTGTGSFADIPVTAGTIPKGNTCLAAFGRVWAADSTGTVMQYSDLLQEGAWSGGSAGSVDLSTVWPTGRDTIQALAAFNGSLIIFGKQNIVIYADPEDPATMYLQDTVSGIGCIARDSVQHIGTDLLFLSNSGIRTLGRTLQTRSMPLSDLTKNIRTYFAEYLITDTSTIRSTYSEIEGFYLISFPAYDVTFCVSIKAMSREGEAYITTWDTITPKALVTTVGNETFIGKTGWIGKYTGYVDNTASYMMEYLGPWIDYGTIKDKIPKRMRLHVYSGGNVVPIAKWAFDYSSNYSTVAVDLKLSPGAEYSSDVTAAGAAQYGTSEYSSGLDFAVVNAPLRGHGKSVQFGVTATIDGAAFSVQRLDFFMKLGSSLR